MVAANLLDPRLAHALELDAGAPVSDDELLTLRDMLETLHQRQQRRAPSLPGLRKATPPNAQPVALLRPADATTAGTSYAVPAIIAALTG